MPTLLLSPRYTADSRALRAAAMRIGWDCVRLADWRIPDWVAERDLVCYGEPLLAEVIVETLPYALLEPSASWLPALPRAYTRREVRLMTLGQARRHVERAFFKPAGTAKPFPAAIRASGAELHGPGAMRADVPVLVQEPVVWDLEVRCFVLDRRVATCSPYLRRGQLLATPDGRWPAEEAEIEEALGFVRTVLADPAVRVPPAVVIDVGTISGDGWAVIEANAAWASGLYGCDPAAVLPVVRRATIRRDALANEDRPWILAPVAGASETTT